MLRTTTDITCDVGECVALVQLITPPLAKYPDASARGHASGSGWQYAWWLPEGQRDHCPKHRVPQPPGAVIYTTATTDDAERAA